MFRVCDYTCDDRLLNIGRFGNMKAVRNIYRARLEPGIPVFRRTYRSNPARELDTVHGPRPTVCTSNYPDWSGRAYLASGGQEEHVWGCSCRLHGHVPRTGCSTNGFYLTCISEMNDNFGWDLRFSWRRVRRWLSTGMLRAVGS
jgi:hypothetical protein